MTGTSSNVSVCRSGGLVEEFLQDQVRPREENFTDLDLICKDGFVPVHRALLIRASSYLSELLIDKDIHQTYAISLPDVTVRHMVQIMAILYSGRTVIDAIDQKEICDILVMLGFPVNDVLLRQATQDDVRRNFELKGYPFPDNSPAETGTNSAPSGCENETDGEMLKTGHSIKSNIAVDQDAEMTETKKGDSTLGTVTDQGSDKENDQLAENSEAQSSLKDKMFENNNILEDSSGETEMEAHDKEGSCEEIHTLTNISNVEDEDLCCEAGSDSNLPNHSQSHLISRTQEEVTTSHLIGTDSETSESEDDNITDQTVHNGRKEHRKSSISTLHNLENLEDSLNYKTDAREDPITTSHNGEITEQLVDITPYEEAESSPQKQSQRHLDIQPNSNPSTNPVSERSVEVRRHSSNSTDYLRKRRMVDSMENGNDIELDDSPPRRVTRSCSISPPQPKRKKPEPKVASVVKNHKGRVLTRRSAKLSLETKDSQDDKILSQNESNFDSFEAPVEPDQTRSSSSRPDTQYLETIELNGIKYNIYGVKDAVNGVLPGKTIAVKADLDDNYDPNSNANSFQTNSD